MKAINNKEIINDVIEDNDENDPNIFESNYLWFKDATSWIPNPRRRKYGA